MHKQSIKHLRLVTVPLVLLAFAGCNKPPTAHAAIADDIPATQKAAPTANQAAAQNGLQTPTQILESEMLAWSEQASRLGGVTDKMMESGEYAPASVYGSLNLAVTTMSLEMKALFMQETMSVMATDKKAKAATAQLLHNSYSEMCKSIDAMSTSLSAGVFNLKRLNYTADAKRIEDMFIKRLKQLKTDFFTKRRDELKAFAESLK